VPSDPLTPREAEQGIAGDFGDTSADEVLELLSPWQNRIEIREGDVFRTLEETETGPLSFVHMDLNASAPTVRALDYCYQRLVSGALVVFDDYGQSKYKDQRRGAIDHFLADRPEGVVVLPTGQAC
jgi:O-methyltransferase